MDINHITNKNEKIALAKKIASTVKDGQTIGFGSGSTSYLTAIEIGEKVRKENITITAIPTSKDIEEVCKKYQIRIGNLVENKIDWSFDGADEVDPKGRLIKGRGAAMFKEKLNIVSSPITYILVDSTKFVQELGKKNPVPIEVFPSALKYVSEELKNLGATETIFRGMTENGNAILDTRFIKIKDELEKQIKMIPGVIESGLFIGYKTQIVMN